MAETYTARTPYLVNQILLGNTTYKAIILVKPAYQAEIDEYISDNNLTIDKTV